MEQIIKISIIGAGGRMGRTLLKLISSDREFRLIEAIEAENSPEQGKSLNKLGNIDINLKISSNKEIGIRDSDVIIDFSTPNSSMKTLEHCIKYKKALVLGTTGFSEDQNQKITDAGKNIPVLYSPNMSIGVNLLFKLTRDVASFLGEKYDVEIFEIHHNKKVDAPSGTAIRLKNQILQGLKVSEGNVVYGRNGHGKRKSGEIGVHALRAGDIVGEHTIIFAGNGERLELKHIAHSRNTFASGAIFAAKYLIREKNSKPGFYFFEDLFKSF